MPILVANQFFFLLIFWPLGATRSVFPFYQWHHTQTFVSHLDWACSSAVKYWRPKKKNIRKTRKLTHFITSPADNGNIKQLVQVGSAVHSSGTIKRRIL
jgi:hypothetical protein